MWIVNLYPFIYSFLVEPFIKAWKQRLTRWHVESQSSCVVDVCCGIGRQCEFLMKNGIKAIGLDLDVNFLRYAKKRCPSIPYVCGDAAHLPFKLDRIPEVQFSLGLHDKSPQIRNRMLLEAQQALVPKGGITILDFEQPWNTLSMAGFYFVSIFEFLAGWEHFKQSRLFIRRGGLSKLAKEHNLAVIKNHLSESGCSSMIRANFGTK